MATLSTSVDTNPYVEDILDDPPDETLRIIMQNGETTIDIQSDYEDYFDEEETKTTSEDSDLKVFKVLIQNSNTNSVSSSRVEIGERNNSGKSVTAELQRLDYLFWQTVHLRLTAVQYFSNV